MSLQIKIVTNLRFYVEFDRYDFDISGDSIPLRMYVGIWMDWKEVADTYDDLLLLLTSSPNFAKKKKKKLT